jgi:hypothetical protein
MLNEAFRTGPIVMGLGQGAPATVGAKGELLFCATRARHYDLNYNRRLFHGTVSGAATAGVSVNGATTLAATSAIVINNPAGSGVNAAIKRLVWQWVSGTMGLSGLYWAYAAAVASPAGTAGVVTGGMLAPGQRACAVYTGASSFGATCTLLRPSAISFSGYLGTSTAAIQPPTQEIPDDDLFCPPGMTLGVVAIGAAGSTDRSILSLSWSEDPI